MAEYQKRAAVWVNISKNSGKKYLQLVEADGTKRIFTLNSKRESNPKAPHFTEFVAREEQPKPKEESPLDDLDLWD